MALKIELGPDKERGPGFGILRIDGLLAVAGGLQVSIQSNQGGGRFLDGLGSWQSQEVWHDLPASGGEGGQSIGLGPDLVDPIAGLPSNVMLRMQVRSGGKSDAGRVVVKDLLHSVASGARPPGDGGTVAHVVPPVAEAAPVEVAPLSHVDRLVPPPASLAPEPKTKRGLKIAQAFFFASFGALLAVAILCYFAVRNYDRPKSETAPPAPVAAAPVSGDLASREDVAKFLQTNPSPEAAVAAARRLAEGGKLDLAMLIYQFAARAGSTDATLALARMYDPATWSQATSPMERADAETAAYWYEPAAQAGNTEAQRRLGKILIDLNQSGFERDKGKDWLGRAAAAGDAQAKTLLDAAK